VKSVVNSSTVTKWRQSIGIVAVLLSSPLAQGLEWKTTHVELSAAPLQRTAATEFEFANHGDKPVTIERVDVSCDCTEAEPSAKVVAPGARGTISVKFTLGDLFGSYQRMVYVKTDEKADPTLLSVQLTVPDVAKLTPRSVEWKLGTPASEQSVDIAVTPGLELNVQNVQTTSQQFSYRLETLEPGKRFRLFLRPTSTQAPVNAAIRVYTKTPSGRDLVLSAYANVRG